MENLNNYSFFDNSGNENYIKIFNDNNFIHIGAYDINKNTLAYLDSFVGSDKVYLDVIFCNPKYRNRGIASKLLDILNDIANGSIIYGTYSPWEISDTKEKTDRIAKSFYEKNGYKIVTLSNYLDHVDDYPSITESDFCISKCSNKHAIIYKKGNVKCKIKIFK